MTTKTTVGPARFWRLLMAGLFLMAAVTSGWAAGSAPDFNLKGLQDSKEYSLSQFKGKVVLLNFFALKCTPCWEEMPHLSQIYQELKGQGCQILGIGLALTPQEFKEIAKKVGEQKLTYPVLEGTDEVRKAYGGVELIPLTFIIDRQGNIAHKILGGRSKAEFENLIKPLL